MKDFLEQMARRFADNPGDIAVSAIAGRRTIILELRCNNRDVGRIIGRSGRVISAIRVLMNALTVKEKKRVILEVVGKE